MAPFFIVVHVKGDFSVVSDSGGRPRTFAKQKKADNFIKGRPSLRAQPTHIVTNINTYFSRWKVDI